MGKAATPRTFCSRITSSTGMIYSLTGNSALQSMIDALYVRTGPWLAYGITNLVRP